MVFNLLNKIQFFLQKPWRPLLKHPNKFYLFLNKYFGWVSWLIQLSLWLALTPLRLINAIYYNIIIYSLWCFYDHLSEIFNPKVNGMRYYHGFKYAFYWFFGLPFRFIKYIWIGLIQFIEGIIFVVVDTVVPAVTMYHGTRRDASINISKPGEWQVGDGNFAGSGIYFTMNKKVAQHYAGSGKDSVIIRSRVSLGKIKNLNLAPANIRSCVKYNGDRITGWALKKRYTTTEWWRSDNQWWEYCILNQRNGRSFKTWRIRILYIHNVGINRKERIWGGKSFWVF